MFLPNTDSFVLIRRTTVKPSFPPEAGDVTTTVLEPTDGEQSKVTDQGKRNFLKVASIVGAGVIASQLSPKRAQALIMGSSPTTGVVGIKNVANTRINPATEETVSSIESKTSDLTFDTGSLQVKVTSLPAAPVQVDVLSSELPSSASTETTLQTIAFGGKKYALRLVTVGDVDYVGEANIGTAISVTGWRIKKIDSTSGIIITWAGTTAANAGGFDYIWNNYAGLDYF